MEELGYWLPSVSTVRHLGGVGLGQKAELQASGRIFPVLSGVGGMFPVRI